MQKKLNFGAIFIFMSQKNTLHTISEQTGYSVSTVSRVLSGQAKKYRISKEAEERITAQAGRLNYQPNLVAQTLRTRKSQTVGLLIPDVDNPFFASLAGIIIGILDSRGYHTLLADSRESGEEEVQELRMLMSHSVDGIICIPASSSPEYHEQVSSQIPLVLIDRHFKNTSLSYVCTDNYAGARMATDYLIGKGYKRILAIQGVPDSMPNKERVRGFKEAIGVHGVNYKVVGDAFSVENGKKEVLNAFAGGRIPYDAVFAFSSTILLGAIDALRSLHIRPGKDVGIISYDNNGFLDFLDPAVTRVEQPLREAGQIAVDTLFEIINARRAGRPDPAPRQLLIPPTLVVRSSC